MIVLGIATWNRAHRLKRCLDAFIDGMSSLPAGSMRILVSDNGSDDGTPALLAEYAQRYAFLDVIRNDTNIGAPRNVWRVMQAAAEQADADYVWLFGDDDLPLPGAVSRVAGLAREMGCDTFHFLKGPAHFLKGAGTEGATTEGTDGPDDTGSLFELACRHGFLKFASALPSLMIRTEKIRGISAERHFGNCLLQSCVIFELYAHGRSCLHRTPVYYYPEKSDAELMEDRRRWSTEGTLSGYFKMAETMERWGHEGLLPVPLEPRFFDAGPHYLWDRFLSITVQMIRCGQPLTEEMEMAIPRLAGLLDNGIVRRTLLERNAWLMATCQTLIAARNELTRQMDLAERRHFDFDGR